ncbi:MEDS domain-containing protein [Roseateles chitosanitabidus]|uniref:MEDS domain-containing protein n=1 Tax=Roseateles chitosanitabidus TaxID=65048 RepID=UPI00147217E1|nr:MEDS domain-containing protein [Roseateles chitosanitabidus]
MDSARSAQGNGRGVPHLSVDGAALRHFHICAFFNSREEEAQVLGPFYREAFRRGERNLHLMAPGALAAHRAALAATGMDVAACEACGQLALATWPVEDGRPRFDAEAWLEVLARAADHPTPRERPPIDDAHERHALAGAGQRLVARMDAALDAGADPIDLLIYEARLNGLVDGRQLPTICVYDLARLDGATMMDLLRTHPLTLIGGVLRENPFFTPPAEMLRELSARRVSGRRRGLPAPGAVPAQSSNLPNRVSARPAR